MSVQSHQNFLSREQVVYMGPDPFGSPFIPEIVKATFAMQNARFPLKGKIFKVTRTPAPLEDKHRRPFIQYSNGYCYAMTSDTSTFELPHMGMAFKARL